MLATAGIVLAGGRSSRMGTPKAALEWHGSTLLRHVTGIVARVTGGPVVVVRAPGQELPALPRGVEVMEDAREGRCRAGTGPAIVAAWATGVQLRPPGAPGIPATVEHVSPGPGRWEITLAAPMALRAHVPLGASPPRPGDRLTARLDPALTAILQPSQGLMI